MFAANERIRAVLILVLAGVLAGIALRLAGYVGGAYSWFSLSGAGDDSWMPMRLAYARATGAAAGSLHDLFFLAHVKFQYPPSSLLLYAAVDAAGIAPTDRAMNVLVWLSILATPAAVFGVCAAYMRNGPFSRAQQRWLALAFAAATLFFYPIMISWRLGQVQAILNLLFALACLCWLTQRRLLAGVLIGTACLVKPQFGLFVLWGVLRRQDRFVAGLLATLGIGLAFSVALFGWRPHLDYLDVLAYISRHGETFWDNTSVNGLFNRFVNPDQTLSFDYRGFPPYDPVVHAATVVSSVAIIAFGLVVTHRSLLRGTIVDFMTAGFCFTLASPIAWGHHFGIAMPILAILVIAAAATDAGRRRGVFPTAAVCYLAFAVDWNVSERLAGTALSVLQSWRLFAAFAVLWLLWRMAAARHPAGAAQAALTSAPAS